MNPLATAAPLLQSRYQFLSTPDTRSTVIFLASALGFVGLITVGGILARRRHRHLDPQVRRKLGRRAFIRTARGLGLQPHHIQTLEHLVRVAKVQRPFLLFTSSGLLDDLLRKAVYALNQSKTLSEEDRQRRLTTLFQIKQIVERGGGRVGALRSTVAIRAGQSVTMATSDGRQHQSRVVSTMRDMIACAAAQDEAGHSVRWPRGTTLKLNFWREGDAGYAFESKVLGYDTLKGQLCVLVHHAKTLRREQQRRYRRSELHRPCFFYPVMVVESGSGRKATRKAVVQSARRLIGNLVDISAGGCSVNSLYPLKPGDLCKIEFELNRRQSMAMFGKVRSVRKSGLRGGVMHVMFTRVSSGLLNQIYLYVYDYAPPPALAPRPLSTARLARAQAPAALPTTVSAGSKG